MANKEKQAENKEKIGIGAWLGMEVFRHKTQHRSFRVVVPLFTCLWLVIVTGAYLYFNVFR